MKNIKTFFYSFTRSLFEPKYYNDVKKADFWFSFKYLWFLLFILVIIKSFVLGGKYIIFRPQIQPVANKILSYANNFYPNSLELKIKNGQLSTNVREPYVIDANNKTIGNNPKHLLIIDTKGSIENYPSYNTYILATKNAIIYPSKAENNRIGETSVFYFSDLKQNLTLNKNVYNNLLNIVRPYTFKAVTFVDMIALSFLILFLSFGSFFWTVGTLLGLVFLIFLVWIVNLIFKKGYEYGTLYRMGMHVVTWPILFNEVKGYINPLFPSFYTIIFLILMIWLIFSLKKYAK